MWWSGAYKWTIQPCKYQARGGKTFLENYSSESDGLNNPSRRFISRCVEAFRAGLYTTELDTTFGSGKYGSLEIFEGASTVFATKRSQPHCPHIRWWLLHLSFERKVTNYFSSINAKQVEMHSRPRTSRQCQKCFNSNTCTSTPKNIRNLEQTCTTPGSMSSQVKKYNYDNITSL